MHQRRETGTDEHHCLGDGIHVMVDIITIKRTLLVTHASDGTVQRIAKPVYKQTRYREPKPIDTIPREGKAQTAHEGTYNTDDGHHITGHPFRQMIAEPNQYFLFRCIQDRCLNTCRLFHFCHNNPIRIYKIGCKVTKKIPHTQIYVGFFLFLTDIDRLRECNDLTGLDDFASSFDEGVEVNLVRIDVH